jgi:hypothetical protein
MNGMTPNGHYQNSHPKCDYCKVHFLGEAELAGHQRTTGHVYCIECNTGFKKRNNQLCHVRKVEHPTTYHCCDCGRQYIDQQSLNDHCCACDKIFKNSQSLQNHTAAKHKNGDTLRDATVRRVRINKSRGNMYNGIGKTVKTTKKDKPKKPKKPEKPKKYISCLASSLCAKRFASPSALLHHLESGRCRSAMTRDKLNNLVITHDQNRYITVERTTNPLLVQSRSSSFISIPGSYSADTSLSIVSGPDVTPDAMAEWRIIGDGNSGVWLSADDLLFAVPGPSSTEDTGSEWSFVSGISSIVLNPNTPAGNTCILCPPNKAPFCTAKALQAHQESAAHCPKMFHCPLALAPGINSGRLQKERFFSTLSGLARHLESGACQGKMEMFRLVFRYVEEQLSAFGFSNFKLSSD